MLLGSLTQSQGARSEAFLTSEASGVPVCVTSRGSFGTAAGFCDSQPASEMGRLASWAVLAPPGPLAT